MELWTREHALTILPALAAMVAISLLLRHLLKGKPDRIRMIPLHIISALLFGIEIGKQLVSYANGYDLYHIPFHFCSLFIFMMPITSLYRGKHRNTVRGITATLCASVFLLMMLYPNLIYSANNIREFFTEYLSFHTVLFHNLVVFAFILFLTLGVHVPQRGERKAVAIFDLCFCIVSATMAQLLKTNYNNFYKCNIAPLETLRQSFWDILGYVPTQILYVVVVTALNLLFVQLAYTFYRAVRIRIK